jgi:hypothetical protein
VAKHIIYDGDFCTCGWQGPPNSGNTHRPDAAADLAERWANKDRDRERLIDSIVAEDAAADTVPAEDQGPGWHGTRADLLVEVEALRETVRNMDAANVAACRAAGVWDANLGVVASIEALRVQVEADAMRVHVLRRERDRALARESALRAENEMLRGNITVLARSEVAIMRRHKALRAGVERAYRDLRSDEIGGYSLERFDAAMSALLAESNG